MYVVYVEYLCKMLYVYMYVTCIYVPSVFPYGLFPTSYAAYLAHLWPISLLIYGLSSDRMSLNYSQHDYVPHDTCEQDGEYLTIDHYHCL